MNKGLKKGLGALAAVASLLALGPLAAANAAHRTRALHGERHRTRPRQTNRAHDRQPTCGLLVCGPHRRTSHRKRSGEKQKTEEP